MILATNFAQKVLLDNYWGGDFAAIRTDADLNECGDTLFIFLFHELSDEEDCTTAPEAYRRLTVARDQIDSIITALDKLETQ